MKRRDSLKLLVGAATTPLFAPSILRAADSQGRYKKYEGTTISVNWPAYPHYDVATEFVPQFTAETGIKVEIDKMQYGRMHDKQLLELSKPQSDYDLLAILGAWKTEYVKKGLLEPLDPLLANAALADPAYDLGDIVPAYLTNIGMVGGPKGYLAGPGARLYALPFGTETSVLAYRADILENLGMKPPTTYDELLAMLAPLKEKSGIGAITSRGQSGHQACHAFLLHLNPLGGRIFNDAWQPTFAGPEGVKAIETLRAFVETGPAGIPSFGFGDMENAFLLGQAALYLDTIAIFGDVKDPKMSKVAGKVGYALHPKGTRYSAESGGFGIAISKRGANKEAAFLFMQWITSKSRDIAIAKAGGVAMRNSTLDDASVLAMYPEYSLLKAQLKYTNPDWRPIIPEWSEIDEQILGVRVSEALIGKSTPQQALNDSLPAIEEVMQRGGYRKS